MTCSKVGIYVGSFDPFHIGHLEAAKIALNYVHQVIIVPNNPNKSKSQRTDLKHRLPIIQLSIVDEPNIIVTDEDVNTLNDKLYDNHHVIGIIGSDQCRKKPKTRVHEWLIVPRVGYKTPVVKWGMDVTYLPESLFINQKWSSTEVRREIMLGALETVGNLCHLCNEEVVSYIKEKELYTLEDQAKQIIAKDPSIICGNSIDSSAISAEITINKIKSNVVVINNTIVMKGFPDVESRYLEYAAFQIAQELCLPIPKYIFGDNFIIVMSYTGKSIKESVNSGYDPYLAGHKVGSLLRKCHNITVVKLGRNNILDNRKIKNMITSGLLKDHTDLLDRYLSNPGTFGYCHGDASVNNFTIMNGSVSMIDFSGLSKMSVTGIPAYEYYQFITSIKSNFNNLDRINAMIRGFVNGYGDTKFTAESDKLFRTYWKFMLGQDYLFDESLIDIIAQ